MKSYDEIVAHTQKIADINGAMAVLSWDKETYLPAEGAALRARQMATLSAIGHQKMTDENYFNGIMSLLQDQALNEEQQINLIRLKRDIEQQTKFSTDFVEKMSLAVSEGYHAWAEARHKSDYTIYEQKLDRLIQLKKEAAEILGYENHPYNALIDQYEYGMTVDILDNVFNQVKNDLVPIIQNLVVQEQPDTSFLEAYFNEDKQWKFGLDVLRDIGYNFQAGRQDKSAHPFSISMGSAADVRVTTRVDEHNYAYMLWSTIHEGGHALYEQGLPTEEYGMPLGQAASLSIHESQSRLWENHVGRSLQFWQYYLPKLKMVFPREFQNIDVNTFYRAINKIAPNLIRTEADELHYHLHVLIRYEIEKAIVTDEIKTKDIPTVWNELYKKYLNIDVSRDADGVLQDVHWAFGSIGYFPTYSLGSFYAAQFYHQAKRDIDSLDEKIAKGEFKPLLQWLRTNVHIHGRRYQSEELCQKITGEPLNLSYFINYIERKFLSL